MVSRIGSIREGVADHVKRNRDDRNDDCREIQLIDQRSVEHHLLALVDQVAQRRDGDGQTQADVGQKDLRANRSGNSQSHAQHDDGNHVGQEIARDDALRTRAQTTGSKVIFSVADDDDLIANEACHGEPAGQTHDERHREQRGTQHVGEKHADNRRRDVVDYVVDFGEQAVELADIAPQRTHDDADECLKEGNHHADEQRGARAAPQTAPQILPDGVCAEPEGAAGLLIFKHEARFGVIVDQVRVALTGQKRLNEREQQQNEQQPEEEHRRLVFAECTQGRTPIGIIGIAAAFARGRIIRSAFKKLIRQLVGMGFQNRCGRLGFLSCAVFEKMKHQRLPPFLYRLIRGSHTAIAISPSSRPNTPITA